MHDGDELILGNVRIGILHTPGHTPEHISFMITDGAASDAPMGLLTGDFVFVGDVGRPDLLEKAAGVKDTMEEGARTLYRSLERLPGPARLAPGAPGSRGRVRVREGARLRPQLHARDTRRW